MTGYRAGLIGPILLLGAALPAAGAIAGLPEPPRPGPMPGVWVGWSNDSLGAEIGHNSDDFRTNSVNLGWKPDPRWVVAGDYSFLTNKGGGSYAPASRIDEFTATVGWLALGDADVATTHLPWLALGVGVRAEGQFGGERIQDGWHGALQFKPVVLPYDGGSVEGLAYAAGSWLWTEHFPWDMPVFPFLERGQLGFQIDADGCVLTGGESQANLGIKLVALGVDGAGWIGVRQQWNNGDWPSHTAAVVADHEAGFWIVYGASFGGWYVNGGVNPENDATMGTVGWQWLRQPGRPGADSIGRMDADLGIYQGISQGVQVRWQPKWLNGIDFMRDHAALLLDYRFGRVPGYSSWTDNSVVQRQGLFGLDLAWSPVRAGWQLIPFAYVAAGARDERIAPHGPAPRFPEDSAVRAVIQGGAGLRLGWGDLPSATRSVRYGIGIGYDYWLPFGERDIANGADQASYQQRGGGIGGKINALVAW